MNREVPAPSSGTGYPDLLEMWRALLNGDWASLAVVPAAPDVSVRLVREALDEVVAGMTDKVRIVDARGLEVAECKQLALDLSLALVDGHRAVTFVDSVIDRLAPLHLVKQTTVVLLVTGVGGLHLDALESTLSAVGPQRILGTVVAPGET